MRSDRKKERAQFYIPVSASMDYGCGNTSQRLGPGVNNFHNARQELRPSYNAVPPPPSLYSSSVELATTSTTAEKVKNIPSANSERVGEKKGRRRPGRKSRQVADSSVFFVNCESSVQSGGCEVSTKVGQVISKVANQKVPISSSQLPCPNSMPNPNFKIKAAHLHQSPPIRPSTRPLAHSFELDKVSPLPTPVKLEQDNIYLSKVGCSSSCCSPTSGQLDVGSKQKESPPVGVPRSKSKELVKTVKPNNGSGPKRSWSLATDCKPVLGQKGWKISSNVSCGSASLENSPIAGHSIRPAEGLGINNMQGNSADIGSLHGAYSWPGTNGFGSPPGFGSGLPFRCKPHNMGVTSGGPGKLFLEHLTFEDVNLAIQTGNAFKGVMRVNAHYRNEAYVTLEGVPLDVLIDGLAAQNRAMEGDVVAVQLNPTFQWPRLKGKQISNNNVGIIDDADTKVGSDAEEKAITETDCSKLLDCECKLAGSCTLAGEDSAGCDWEQFSQAGLGSSFHSNSPLMLRGDTAFNNQGHFEGKLTSNGLNRAASQPVPLEVERHTPETSKFVKSQTQADTRKEILLTGDTIDAEGRSEAMASISRLAAVVASMPGRRPTGKVVSILERSSRREAVIGCLEYQGSGCGEKGNALEITTQLGRKPARICGGNLTFIPVDNRFPKMVVFSSGIPEDLTKRVKDGDITVSTELVVAKVDGWKSTSLLPRATITQSLGLGGTIEAQTAAILFENAIHRAEFPLSSLACLPQIPWKIPHQEFQKREDLRSLRIFSIDPPTAKDLDDALSVERMAEGKFRVGVHIADVSFFVQPETALDTEAQNRSTSVYLIQKVLPMLPPLLCEELCSLEPGVDRLAYSVIWTMDSTGCVLDQWIGRTIICSCAKLAYGHAQNMIDGTFTVAEEGLIRKEGLGLSADVPIFHGAHRWQDVCADVLTLHDIAKIRRASRFDGGALRLENSKLVFALDEDGEPCDSMMYQHQDSNFLVEEFMLLANMTVARVISSAFPHRALLRRHPEPSIRKLKNFEEFCTKNGFDLDVSSSGALNLSFEKLRETKKEDPVLFDILMRYATKVMQLAKYFCTGELEGKEEDWAHYALAVPFYTHFTSPIRRYADIVVHRTLSAALEAEEMLGKLRMSLNVGGNGSKISGFFKCFSGSEFNRKMTGSEVVRKALIAAAEKYRIPGVLELALVAGHCNERKLASRNVKEASDKLYLWTMVKNKQGVLSNSRVLALGPKFMSLYVCKIGMEMRIYYDEIEGLNSEWFEGTGTLVLNLLPEKMSPEKVSQRKHGQGRPQRTVADVALLVNPTDTLPTNLDPESYEDIIREVEDRLAGKIILEDEDDIVSQKEVWASDEVEPAVLPLTLRWFSSVPVSIHAIGGEGKPLDIAIRLYVSSYET